MDLPVILSWALVWEEAAAQKIQAVQRGRATRKEMEKLKLAGEANIDEVKAQQADVSDCAKEREQTGP